MRAIIIGAGKLGFSIAQLLTWENNDVVVIDKNQERLKVIENNLDVQTLHGNGSSLTVLKEAGAKEANLLVAVTESDELNMIACVFGKKMGVQRVVARIRDPEYLGNNGITCEEALGIDLAINPERVTAKLIAELVKTPEAVNVDYYAQGRVQMIELMLTEDTPIINKRLKDLKFEEPYLIAAIHRQGKMIIPSGNSMLLPGDLVFVIAETKLMHKIERLLGQKRTKVEKVFILGGGRIGYYLAKLLDKRNLQVKIMDNDLKKCRRLSEELQHTLVLHGDGTDLNLLEEEDAGDSDLFIAVTGDDKVNMLVSLLAKNLGAKKAIAQIRRSDYAHLVEKVGVDIAVSPRNLAAGKILKFIRKGDIISVALLGEAKAEMIELIVPQDSHLKNKTLKNLKFPPNALIGAIVRENQVIVPSGDDVILPGDDVIVFALPESIKKVEKFFVK